MTIDNRLRGLSFGALVIGLLLRTLPLLLDPSGVLQTCDGRAYHELAVSWTRTHTFTITDPGLVQSCLGYVQLGPSHHFAPGLPLIESIGITLLGDSALGYVVPLLLLSWAVVAVAWLTTRNLFGRDSALLVAAAISLDWTGVIYGTFLGYSENLVLITLILTLWAIVRGLRNERFITAAGLFAGLGYLSKASIGWFFLIAGFGGLLYRVAFRGWTVLKSRPYWAGIALFAVPVVTWSVRNVTQFWDGTLLGLIDAWQTSEPSSRAVAAAVDHPDLFVLAAAVKLPLLLGLLTLPFWPLLSPLIDGVRAWRQEDVFGLWLCAGLIVLIGWLLASAFWVTEQTNLLWADAVRYVMPAQIPVLWIAVRRGRASTGAWSISLGLRFAMCFALPASQLAGMPFAR